MLSVSEPEAPPEDEIVKRFAPPADPFKKVMAALALLVKYKPVNLTLPDIEAQPLVVVTAFASER